MQYQDWYDISIFIFFIGFISLLISEGVSKTSNRYIRSIKTTQISFSIGIAVSAITFIMELSYPEHDKNVRNFDLCKGWMHKEKANLCKQSPKKKEEILRPIIDAYDRKKVIEFKNDIKGINNRSVIDKSLYEDLPLSELNDDDFDFIRFGYFSFEPDYLPDFWNKPVSINAVLIRKRERPFEITWKLKLGFLKPSFDADIENLHRDEREHFEKTFDIAGKEVTFCEKQTWLCYGKFYGRFKFNGEYRNKVFVIDAFEFSPLTRYAYME